MCGITGVFVLGGGRPADAAVVREMTACLVHRGPDDDGHYATDGLCLGFRRLALNDLAGGNQPHRTEDGTLVSVCNGEIYNHRELRTALSRRGHRFRTENDTEVLLHLYREYGEDLTAHLDGQFGFALHDAAAQRLLLARDRAGIVPLFYTVADGQLIFASEIKAILRHPAVSARVDLRGLDQVLTLPGLVSPRTMFEGISALRPGERLIADRSGVRTERYWDLDFPLAADLDPVAPEALDRELERYAHRTAELLDGAVRSRLLADVPIGMYLSGGLDSSLIGALMARARPGHAWPSFSVTFPGRDFDEGPHQRLVAAKLGTEHHEVPVGEHEVAERITAMVRHAEAPVRESYNVCSLALSEAVRAAGTVGALSGEGADELFGGYPGYRFDATGLGGSRRSPAWTPGWSARSANGCGASTSATSRTSCPPRSSAASCTPRTWLTGWTSSPSPTSAWSTPGGWPGATRCTSAPTSTTTCGSPTTCSATTATGWPWPTASSCAFPSWRTRWSTTPPRCHRS